MAILHFVRSSAFDNNDFKQCISLLQNNDGIVLIDDGCYNLHHSLLTEAINKITKDNICVIEHHYLARGITLKHHEIAVIDMNKLVSLTLNFDKTLTWQST